MSHPVSRALAISCSLLALVTSPVAMAGVLVLHNGDRITGEITAVWDAEITIEPEYSDEFTVDMDVIAYIESETRFEIDIADGRSVTASFAGADENGNQILDTGDGLVTIALMDLYELDEIAKEFDWESHADFSSSLNSGNTDSMNTRLYGDTTITHGDHRHFADLTFVREEQDSVSTKESDLVRYNYNFLFNDPWFFAAGISAERDPIRELDHRVTISGGIGRDIWNTPRLLLNMQLGLGYITEKIGASNEESSAVVWGLRYRQDLFDEDLEIFHNNSITHYIGGRDNTIYKTSTGLRYEITDLLYANVSLDYDYETEPVEAAENEDVVFAVGVGVEF